MTLTLGLTRNGQNFRAAQLTREDRASVLELAGGTVMEDGRVVFKWSQGATSPLREVHEMGVEGVKFIIQTEVGERELREGDWLVKVLGDDPYFLVYSNDNFQATFRSES